MVIKAVIDRIENENAILVSSETGMEISVPISSVEGECNEGEAYSIIIEEKNK